MKRKYFSALLMGALTIASVSTFTSCKDYDDDISSLQSQIDKLNEMVSKIQGQIDNGAILTGVNPVENGVKLTLSNGKDYTITNGKDGAKGEAGAAGAPGTPGKDADVWKIGDDGYWYKNDTKTNYKAVGTDGTPGAAGTAGTPGKDGKYYVPNPQTGTFFVYGDGDKAAYDSGVTYMTPGIITATWTKDALTLNGVKNEAGEQVVINLTTDLKSLVFSPEFYYQGIEALELQTMEYIPLKVPAAADANKNMSTDKAEAINADDVFRYAPEMAATYFLNPKNSKIETKTENFEFVWYDKKYTRADETNTTRNFVISSATNKEGELVVKAKYNGDAIKDINDDKQVTVLALKYKGTNNDGVISDFAAVRANIYKGLALNLVSTDNHEHASSETSATHLYTSAEAAIAADAQIDVAWNSSVNLAEKINTVRINSEGKCISWDGNAADGQLKKDAGFEYSFELVGYEEGDNFTSQSAHAWINGTVLRPQMPKDGKQVNGEYTQSEATIGRKPLVRVTLKDAVNNKIVAVGYVKVNITSGETIDTPLSIDLKPSTETYTIKCTGDQTIQQLKWHDVEEQIIAKLGMSKADFEAKYKLDGGEDNATQYGGEKDEALPSDKYIGKISQTKTDGADAETEILSWTIEANKAYDLFKDGKTKSATTKIRYSLQSGNTAKYEHILITFTWNPDAINNAPKTSFSNTENKIKGNWYAANNAEAGSGYDEIHGNVQLVAADNTDKYEFDIKKGLNGNKLAVAKLTGAYKDLNDNLEADIVFVDGYKLYAGEVDAHKLYSVAGKASQNATNMVASIENGVVTLATTAVAKELLNKYAPTDLANTLTAKVAVKATLCDNINVPVENNTFNVKFLRPITVKDGSIEAFNDAETDGNVKKLNLNFVDWRGYKFNVDKATKGVDYFNYYKVSKIEIDTKKVETDLNGERKLLSDITSEVKFVYNDVNVVGQNIADGEYGTITYINNGLTVGNFHAWFPVTITYEWGTIKTEVEATIKATSVGARKH